MEGSLCSFSHMNLPLWFTNTNLPLQFYQYDFFTWHGEYTMRFCLVIFVFLSKLNNIFSNMIFIISVFLSLYFYYLSVFLSLCLFLSLCFFLNQITCLLKTIWLSLCFYLNHILAIVFPLTFCPLINLCVFSQLYELSQVFYYLDSSLPSPTN